MPPKKADPGQKKAAIKKKEKAVADATFGLKNKNKSKKVQAMVQQRQAQAKFIGKTPDEIREAEARRANKAREKEEKEEMAKLNAALFRTVGGPGGGVKQAHVPEGADPKSILCAFFKAGACGKGKKCKFSHDLGQGRKAAKINIYEDPRKQDTMDSWDQSKLEQVVKSKEHKPNETKIVCKYFLEAIEKKKYGWFWECPNGNHTCKYKHCLPPGYVLKSEAKKMEAVEDEDKLTLEEEIELERKKLDLSKCTPVTLERLLKWKEDKKKQKEKDVEEKRKAAEKKSGNKGMDVLSGRDLFRYDPSLFVDDEDAVDDTSYEVDEAANEEEEVYEYKAKSLEEIAAEAAAAGTFDEDLDDLYDITTHYDEEEVEHGLKEDVPDSVPEQPEQQQQEEEEKGEAEEDEDEEEDDEEEDDDDEEEDEEDDEEEEEEEKEEGAGTAEVEVATTAIAEDLFLEDAALPDDDE